MRDVAAGVRVSDVVTGLRTPNTSTVGGGASASASREALLAHGRRRFEELRSSARPATRTTRLVEASPTDALGGTAAAAGGGGGRALWKTPHRGAGEEAVDLT